MKLSVRSYSLIPYCRVVELSNPFVLPSNALGSMMTQLKFPDDIGSGDAKPPGYSENLLCSGELWSVENGLGPGSICSSSPTTASFSSVQFSTVSSAGSYDEMRRLSIISHSNSDLSCDTKSSPLTPHQTLPWHIPLAAGVSRKLFVSPTHRSVDSLRPEHFTVDHNLWVSDGLSVPLVQPLYSSIAVSGVQNNTWNNNGSLVVFGDGSSNTSSSEQVVFDNTHNLLDDSFNHEAPKWTTPHVWQAPQTVAPHATFQALLSSSPMANMESSSPFQFDVSGQAATFPDSSPSPISSPCIMPFAATPSQPYRDHRSSDMIGQCNGRKSREKKHRRQQRRVTSSANHSFCSEMTTRPKVRHEAVIPKNQYVCGYADCFDKKGNRKSFRRQEHRKRHMDTIHEQIDRFTCWVSRCHKVFSRRDNLRVHYHNTHGKNSSAQRNRYVATLDKKSEYYDPEWEGELTEDGYPLVPELKKLKCWIPNCEKSYHMREKLRIHLLQQHGRRSADSDIAYVASLDEHSSCFDPDWESRMMQGNLPAYREL